MNYYERHIGDYLKDTAHLSLLEHGVYGRLLDVYYTRESAIPDAQAARLVGARSKDELAALKAVLSEFFTQSEDGADWIHSRCEREIDRYMEKQVGKDEGKEAAKERQRRARERRSHLFEALRAHGITMAYKATTIELEAALSRATIDAGHKDVTRDESHHVTRDDTATQTPDTRHQTPVIQRVVVASTSEAPTTWEQWRIWFEQNHGVEHDPYSANQRGKFRPMAQAWVNAGVTIETMQGAIAKAKREATESIAYLPGYVDRVLATMQQPQRPPTQAEMNTLAAGYGTGLYSASSSTFDPTLDDPEIIDVIPRRIAP